MDLETLALKPFGTIYFCLKAEIAINTTRSKSDHDKRRRIWDSGFSNRALETYEATVVEYGKRLESRIAELSAKSQAINVSLWFYWFTFDVMGIFAFARSFDMLQKEEWHVSVVMLRKATRLLGPLSPVPWLAQIGFNISPWLWVVRDWLAMLAWCRDRMSERLKVCSNRVVLELCNAHAICRYQRITMMSHIG